MLRAEQLQELISALSGKIELCGELVKHGACNWDCCTYTDSYLLFLPGEWEAAQALGYDLSPYRVLDSNFHGGVKAVPQNMGCCVSPEQGVHSYKSIDCRLYPYWFDIDGSDRFTLVQGNICPLIKRQEPIKQHRQRVLAVFDLIKNDEDIISFLKNAKMVGYSRSLID